MKLPNLGEFRILTLRETPHFEPICDTPDRAAEYWQQNIAPGPYFNPDVESFYTLALSTRRKVLGHYLVSHGTLDTILVHPREVFRPALLTAAAAVILAHNHPSGNHSPSEADIKVTRDLIRAGQLLQVQVLDHVIIGAATPDQPRAFASLRELGYFYS